MVSAMVAHRARSGLPSFHDVRHLESVDSTNNYLLHQAALGADEGMVVVAEHQERGHGRLGRHWEAPPGSSLLLSVLLRPTLPDRLLFWCSTALAAAAADAAAQVADIAVGLKWPNDLVVDADVVRARSTRPVADDSGATPERKLGGVLAERTGDALVVGLGLNVNWPAAFPPEIAAIATSLNHLDGGARAAAGSGGGPVATIDRSIVLEAVLDGFAWRYLELSQTGGTERARDEYRRRCVTLGRDVAVQLAQGTVVGVAQDVDEEGHLLVETAPAAGPSAVGSTATGQPAAVAGRGDGARGETRPGASDQGLRSFSAGDVVHLRDMHG